MTTAPDTTPAETTETTETTKVPEPVSLAKTSDTEPEPVNLAKAATDAEDAAPVMRPAGDILGQILDEHPEWGTLLDITETWAYPEPVFLDNEPSLRDRFKQEIAANAVGLETDRRNLARWHREAIVRCTDHITTESSIRAARTAVLA